MAKQESPQGVAVNHKGNNIKTRLWVMGIPA